MLKIIFKIFLLNFVAVSYSMYENAPFTNPHEKFKNEQESARYWLPIAAYRGDLEKAKELIGKINPDDIDLGQPWWRSGPAWNALEAAVIAGQEAIVALLLQKGANPNHATGGTQIDRTAPWLPDLPEVPQTIINNFADIFNSGVNAPTPLVFAVLVGNAPLVRLLLDYGANPKITLNGKDLISLAESDIRDLLSKGKERPAHGLAKSPPGMQEKPIRCSLSAESRVKKEKKSQGSALVRIKKSSDSLLKRLRRLSDTLGVLNGVLL